MGWSHCGTDSEGREIGYGIEAMCDEPGCDAEIDRGLAYACGGMHGSPPGCEGYFCPEHLVLGVDAYLCERCKEKEMAEPLTSDELERIREQVTASLQRRAPAFARRIAPVYRLLGWVWALPPETRVPTEAEISKSIHSKIEGLRFDDPEMCGFSVDSGGIRLGWERDSDTGCVQAFIAFTDADRDFDVCDGDAA